MRKIPLFFSSFLCVLCVFFATFFATGCSLLNTNVAKNQQNSTNSTKQTANFTVKSFSVTQNNETKTLHISKNGETYHFALFDGFGTPLAAKTLQNGKFKNDKFLPPTGELEPFFEAILAAINRGEKSVNFNDWSAYELHQ